MNSKTKRTIDQLLSGPLSEQMPVAFIGHGNPMNAINDSRFAHEWQRISSLIPIPKAVICFSAHWMTNGLRVTASPSPQTIHDFYGFPPQLYDVQFPVQGSPVLAAETQTFIDHLELDHEWGYDHGAWTVLMHMYPQMDIPVIQLSIDMHAPLEQLYNTIAQLKPLRDRGVLMLGSGNLVHNLGMVSFNEGAQSYDWAQEFDLKTEQYIADHNHSPLLNYRSLGTAATLSIPTEDHYRPAMMTLALTTDNDSITFFTEDIEHSSVSMRSFIAGAIA